jgi:hypothetical protein
MQERCSLSKVSLDAQKSCQRECACLSSINITTPPRFNGFQRNESKEGADESSRLSSTQAESIIATNVVVDILEAALELQLEK